MYQVLANKVFTISPSPDMEMGEPFKITGQIDYDELYDSVVSDFPTVIRCRNNAKDGEFDFTVTGIDKKNEPSLIFADGNDGNATVMWVYLQDGDVWCIISLVENKGAEYTAGNGIEITQDNVINNTMIYEAGNGIEITEDNVIKNTSSLIQNHAIKDITSAFYTNLLSDITSGDTYLIGINKRKNFPDNGNIKIRLFSNNAVTLFEHTYTEPIVTLLLRGYSYSLANFPYRLDAVIDGVIGTGSIDVTIYKLP